MSVKPLQSPSHDVVIETYSMAAVTLARDTFLERIGRFSAWTYPYEKRGILVCK